MLRFILASLLAFHLVQADDDESPDDTFQFITRPDIRAPKWDIKIYDRDELQQGHYWFVAPYDNLPQKIYPLWNGPHIYDTSGELVWSGAPFVEYLNTYDFKMSEIDGQQMLSFIWSKKHGDGYILDSSYEFYAKVDMSAGNSSRGNMHELNLIDEGKRALIVLSQNYTTRQIKVPEYSGPCEIGQQGIRELDVKTGRVNFDWHTQDHIRPEEIRLTSATHDTWEELCADHWGMSNRFRRLFEINVI